MTEEKVEYYDDGNFMVITTRYGLFSSRDREGKGLTCGLDKDAVVFWSREHLNGGQNSWKSYPGTKMTDIDI